MKQKYLAAELLANLLKDEIKQPGHPMLCCVGMESVTNANFGLLIAYLVPGATALFGISDSYPSLWSWFAVAPANAPTIGGFLF